MIDQNDFVHKPAFFAISGFSGSGKTRMIEKLVSGLKSQYRIGYIKNHHGFEGSHLSSSKDTDRVFETGVQFTTLIQPQSPQISVQINQTDQLRSLYSKSDLILLEGFKNQPIPKLVMLDPKLDILKEVNQGHIPEIVAYCGPWEDSPDRDRIHPYFNWNEIESIGRVMINHCQSAIRTPLVGLILVGGRSQRLGKDKSLLTYNHETQVERLTRILKPWCDALVISCNADQKSQLKFKTSHVVDIIGDFGPLGGLASAYFTFYRHALLVVACDMPFIDDECIAELVRARDPLKNITCFFNPIRGDIEPLCAIYEASMKEPLVHFLFQGGRSVKKLICENEKHLKILRANDAKKFFNVNFWSDYLEASNRIKDNQEQLNNDGFRNCSMPLSESSKDVCRSTYKPPHLD